MAEPRTEDEPRTLTGRGLAAFMGGLTGSDQFGRQLAWVESEAVAAERTRLRSAVEALASGTRRIPVTGGDYTIIFGSVEVFRAAVLDLLDAPPDAP